MWVLIVNGTESRNSALSFKAFNKAVRAAFAVSACPDVKFKVATYKTLTPWLYEEGSEYADPVAVTRFDRVDFVFVYGDPSILPWMRVARPVRLLLKMCYHTGKATFCSGFGGQLLAYVAATGGKEVAVTNGGGRGGDLADITTAPVPVRDERHPLVRHTPVFLDDRTGDAFRYNAGRKVWSPYANVGLCRRDLGRHRGKYRPKEATHKLVEQVYVAKRHETACRVDVVHLHHWALATLPREFVVPVWGRWKLEPRSIRVRVPSFTTLAEAPWGPLIFEVSNLLGCLFDVTPKNKHSVRLLQNFVTHKFQLMQQYEHIDNSSAMFLPSHPKGPSGEPLMPQLEFGPSASVRASGQALASPRTGAKSSAGPSSRTAYRRRSSIAKKVAAAAAATAAADANTKHAAGAGEAGQGQGQGEDEPAPAFNTFHSTHMRVPSAGRRRRPVSATTRTLYQPASPHAAGGRGPAPSSATGPLPARGKRRPVSARPVLSGATGSLSSRSGRRGSTHSHASSSHHHRRPESARSHASWTQSSRGVHGRGVQQVPHAPSGRRSSAASAVLSPRGSRARAASAQPAVSLHHTLTHPPAMAGATTEYSARPPRPAAPPRHGSTAPALPASSRRPRSAASAAAARRGASLRPKNETNPLSPRDRTAAGIAAYAFPEARGEEDEGSDDVGGDEEDEGSEAAAEPAAKLKKVVLRYTRTPFSSYKKFKKMAEKDRLRPGGNFFSVVNDGTPYMSADERRRAEARESKKAWTGPKFVATFGQATTNIGKVASILACGPYQPHVNHKFRDEDKSKFLNRKGFIVAG